VKNLRVDLILETEMRSPSPISLKLAVRAVGFSLLAAIILGTLAFVLQVRRIKNEKIRLQTEFVRLEPKQQKVKDFQKENGGNQKLLDEIIGWNKARICWSQHMADFRAIVPENIQITSFRIDETNPGTTRAFQLALMGRAEGENPTGLVDSLLTALQKGAGFSNLVASVAVQSIATIPGDNKPHRLFTIDVRYVARSY